MPLVASGIRVDGLRRGQRRRPRGAAGVPPPPAQRRRGRPMTRWILLHRVLRTQQPSGPESELLSCRHPILAGCGCRPPTLEAQCWLSRQHREGDAASAANPVTLKMGGHGSDGMACKSWRSGRSAVITDGSRRMRSISQGHSSVRAACHRASIVEQGLALEQSFSLRCGAIQRGSAAADVLRRHSFPCLQLGCAGQRSAVWVTSLSSLTASSSRTGAAGCCPCTVMGRAARQHS